MFSAVNPLRLYQFIRHMGFGIVTVKLIGIEVALGMLLFVGIQTVYTAPAYYLMPGTCIVVYPILMLFRCIGTPTVRTTPSWLWNSWVILKRISPSTRG